GEGQGKVLSLDADPTKADKKLVLDVGHTVYGVVLHPQFQTNGFIYLSEVPDTDKETQDGSRVVRYTVTDREKMTADPKSAKVILTWPSGGANGGRPPVRAGGRFFLLPRHRDGGPGRPPTPPRLSHPPRAPPPLRRDVDKEEGGKAYRIPSDNPFVNTKGARGENWAYGIRQCWKIGFDSATGELWAGEVGQDLWESVYLIEKGGNYGWSVNEGSH